MGRGPRDDYSGKATWDALQVVRLRVAAQGAILASLSSRIEGVLADVEAALADRRPHDPLKDAGVNGTAEWRRIQLLGDIRNLCTHKKDVEPTKEQVTDLIEGVNWAVKTVA